MMTLKAKYADFSQVTRNRTGAAPISSHGELEQISFALLEPLFPIPIGIRLLGVTLSALKRIGGVRCTIAAHGITARGTTATCTSGNPGSIIDMTKRIVLGPLAILAFSAATVGPAFGACTVSPRINTPEATASDLQRSGCKSGEIATVTSLPADAAAPLIRKVCAFNQEIVVIPREPRPPGSLVDLLCIYSPR